MDQHLMWAADGVAIGIVLVAGLADWKRSRRTDLDDSGWMPWRGIQIVAIFAAIAFAILAMHG
ncbi:hypothetical protein RCO27_13685 [Sphingosinicella sp. LHD-64]|uniref:hypothetical protein n=1 Tax=Sphingosinicella sp. LHD-64 TaxID=3072139 RepID=UPI00280D9BF8|nr:hypothetical protein [Sphingosinicella sp. LHD-64]MDQ8757277.1 hypothetical protein [Sphingosinicella sp. LHD-64]